MARPRQPVKLLEFKGKKHLTKEEIRQREADEVKPVPKGIKPPAYLSESQKKLFRKLAKQLSKLEIMGETDNDALARLVIAQERFGMPECVCSAIRWHTTGRPNMTRLEKIIYLADMLEPNRDFPGVDELRALAFEDLDAAMAKALESSVKSLRRREMNVYKDTLEAYRWYSRISEQEE